MIRKLLLPAALLLFIQSAYPQSGDSAMVASIYNNSLSSGRAYNWLEALCKRYGKRLSGSRGAEDAISFVSNQLVSLDYAKVYQQDVKVPHWIRGAKEEGTIITGKNKTPVNICALGGSIATPGDGIKAKVIEITDFAELEKLGRDKIKGKIIFYNHPMNPVLYNTFQAYGEAVMYRWAGANRAAGYGAAGVIVRSVTMAEDDFPHTGAMAPYVDSVPQIPACAISIVGAQRLSSVLKNNKDVEFMFRQSCLKLPDTLSHNVIAEIKGSEYPDEVILVGGHLDAWDLGEGAHDDGAGVVQAMEMIRLFKDLNIKPKRTIRCVAFINEENGGKGGEKYAELSKQKNEKSIAAIESDGGGATPYGFSMKGDSLSIEYVKKWSYLFTSHGVHEWIHGHGGADIDHLEDQGTLLIGLMADSQRYFDYHHAASDTFDKVNKRELELGAASMAALVYLLSEYGIQ